MNNQEKIEDLVDELYALQKQAGERMVKLTEENKKTLDEMQKIQFEMEVFVKKGAKEAQAGNTFILYIILFIFFVAAGAFIYSMLSMKGSIIYYTEAVGQQSKELYKLGRDMNTVMNNLYIGQKKFLKENKCHSGKKKGVH